MMLLDANVLVYSHDEDSPHHAGVSHWLEETMARREEVGLPWIVILAFLRLMTNPAAFHHPYSMPEALGIVDGYLSRSHVMVVQPTPQHWQIFRGISGEAQITHRLVSDAHLAALTIEHGAELCTTDRDFRRFRGLQIIDPLARQ
jgi:hypothetical protein